MYMIMHTAYCIRIMYSIAAQKTLFSLHDLIQIFCTSTNNADELHDVKCKPHTLQRAVIRSMPLLRPIQPADCRL